MYTETKIIATGQNLLLSEYGIFSMPAVKLESSTVIVTHVRYHFLPSFLWLMAVQPSACVRVLDDSPKGRFEWRRAIEETARGLALYCPEATLSFSHSALCRTTDRPSTTQENKWPLVSRCGGRRHSSPCTPACTAAPVYLLSADRCTTYCGQIAVYTFCADNTFCTVCVACCFDL